MKAVLLSVAACAALAAGAAHAQPFGYAHVQPEGQTTPWQAVPGYSEMYEGSSGTVYGYSSIHGGVPLYQQRNPYDQRVGRDRDGDGIPDRLDNDRDNDGVANPYDRRPDDPRRR